MNNKAIIEFGFRRIWRILQTSEGVTWRGLFDIIIQQIVTLSKYGHDALDIRHPKVTDIRRYT